MLCGDNITSHRDHLLSQVTSAQDIKKCLISDRDEYGTILASCQPIFTFWVDLGMLYWPRTLPELVLNGIHKAFRCPDFLEWIRRLSLPFR